MNRTRCLDTIEAVGLRAISGTIKKSDHITIGHNSREQWHCRGKVACGLIGEFVHWELRGDE